MQDLATRDPVCRMTTTLYCVAADCGRYPAAQASPFPHGPYRYSLSMYSGYGSVLMFSSMITRVVTRQSLPQLPLLDPLISTFVWFTPVSSSTYGVGTSSDLRFGALRAFLRST
jgi:hypothetical protein